VALDREPELIADAQALVGEGALWDGRAGVLYWVDIRTGRFFRYDPASGRHEQLHRGVNVGGLRVNRRGGLTLGTWEGIQLWRSDGDVTWLHRDPKYRFNDVAAGPDGSFYAGAYFDDAPGVLYRFFPDGRVESVAEGVGISNGMGFSPDLRVFYHTDSLVRTIYRYGYDPATHSLGDRRVFVRLSDDEGVPDGMTVDADGHVWSAVWGGGCVIRFDPDGKEERRLRFPATQTSSVAFGGPDLADLYVTTASFGAGGPPSGLEPTGYDFTAHRGGELYRRRDVGVRGKPEFETDFAWPA
jgi:D-xylono/L-arabinono-1,4-lactonase